MLSIVPDTNVLLRGICALSGLLLLRCSCNATESYKEVSKWPKLPNVLIVMLTYAKNCKCEGTPGAIVTL